MLSPPAYSKPPADMPATQGTTAYMVFLCKTEDSCLTNARTLLALSILISHKYTKRQTYIYVSTKQTKIKSSMDASVKTSSASFSELIVPIV